MEKAILQGRPWNQLQTIDATPKNTYCRSRGAQLVPTLAHAFLGPKARVLAMTRDPTERVFSEDRYVSAFHDQRGAKHDTRCASASAEHFHEHMESEVAVVEECVASNWGSTSCQRKLCIEASQSPFAACPPGKLISGLYEGHFAEWRRLFGPRCGEPNRFFEVRLEDMAANPRDVLRSVADFLSLDINDTILDDMAHAERTRPEDSEGRIRVAGKIPDLGPMLNKTRVMLDAFYARHRQATLPSWTPCPP